MLDLFDLDGVFIIAEAGVNHDGSLVKAKQLVDVAVECGANAVKFQTFKAEDLLTDGAPKATYQKQTTDKLESQFDMLKKLELRKDQFKELFLYCKSKEIMFLSTPFDCGSVDCLEEIGVCAYKVASGELTNLPLLRKIKSTGKPTIISTGMATLGEIEEAMYIFLRKNVALLHCLSNYPAAHHEVNLKVLYTLKQAFDVPVGYSDHTIGNEVAIASVALGACIVEKHITLDKTASGPDHKASANPEEFKELVCQIRNVESSLGTAIKCPSVSEIDTAKALRKSIVVVEDIKKGTVITEEMLGIKRPEGGLPARFLDYVIGTVAVRDFKTGEFFTFHM